LCLIASFIPLLNSLIKAYSFYLLPLITLLDSYTNSSIVFDHYSTLFNFTTLANMLFPLLNSFFCLARKSLTNGNSNFLVSKSSKTFFFQISTNSSYTYVKTHYSYSSTDTFLILNLIYNLHTITKHATLLVFLLDVDSLVTSALNLVLDLRATIFSFSCSAAFLFFKSTICYMECNCRPW